jgi:hypothetical protein
MAKQRDDEEFWGQVAQLAYCVDGEPPETGREYLECFLKHFPEYDIDTPEGYRRYVVSHVLSVWLAGFPTYAEEEKVT